ncbi:MAG: AlpA family phage regulatory protein [Desulfovibrionaceae bacterium]|nr:AlpA family phage regulatory protein [Desulfovibrionaceae bacterium]
MDFTEKQLWRVADLVRILGISKATVWRWLKSGKLPEPIRLGAKVVVWKKTEIENFIQSLGTEAQNG